MLKVPVRATLKAVFAHDLLCHEQTGQTMSSGDVTLIGVFSDEKSARKAYETDAKELGCDLDGKVAMCDGKRQHFYSVLDVPIDARIDTSIVGADGFRRRHKKEAVINARAA